MTKKLKRCFKTYTYTTFILTFEDELGGQEPQTIELKNEPSEEFLVTFMENQEFTKVTIKEVSTEVKGLGFDI